MLASSSPISCCVDVSNSSPRPTRTAILPRCTSATVSKAVSIGRIHGGFTADGVEPILQMVDQFILERATGFLVDRLIARCQARETCRES